MSDLQVEYIQELQDRIAALEAELRTANEHQLASDKRISNQRQEIQNQQRELNEARRRLSLLDRWKQESEEWRNDNSTFWKIYRDKKVKALEAELRGVREAAIVARSWMFCSDDESTSRQEQYHRDLITVHKAIESTGAPEGKK